MDRRAPRSRKKEVMCDFIVVKSATCRRIATKQAGMQEQLIAIVSSRMLLGISLGLEYGDVVMIPTYVRYAAGIRFQVASPL